jgi:acid phosphatase
VRLHSVLWAQTSPEYQIAAAQGYVLAKEMLDKGLQDPTWTAALEQVGDYSVLPPAVILDVDETILDNFPFQARLVQINKDWSPEMFLEWVYQANANAVPGSVEFIKYAIDRGVEVFFVTNRSSNLEEVTRENLSRIGIPENHEVDTLLTKDEVDGWGSDKTSRREFLADQYRIILLIGDDANDFLGGTRNIEPNRRVKLVSQYTEYWGTKWITIPNPVYGSWDRAVYGFDPYLSEAQIIERKIKLLDTRE